ncbi:MAG: hypothetical protein ABI425_05050 [Patescibacteria group bacterium]
MHESAADHYFQALEELSSTFIPTFTEYTADDPTIAELKPDEKIYLFLEAKDSIKDELDKSGDESSGYPEGVKHILDELMNLTKVFQKEVVLSLEGVENFPKYWDELVNLAKQTKPILDQQRN